jgi:hypothetical protein
VRRAPRQTPRADLRVTLVVTLVGKAAARGWCRRHNAVLNPPTAERHFEDTIRGGAFLNDQDLVWILVTRAPQMVAELENAYGCFFDRNPDGTIHQKAFGGQSFDRTIHRGDLTGIEIMERLRDAVLAQEVQILEDHRAVRLLRDRSGSASAATCCSICAAARRRGPRAGGAVGDRWWSTMYDPSPSREKELRSIAMAYEAAPSWTWRWCSSIHGSSYRTRNCALCWRRSCVALADG